MEEVSLCVKNLRHRMPCHRVLYTKVCTDLREIRTSSRKIFSVP